MSTNTIPLAASAIARDLAQAGWTRRGVHAYRDGQRIDADDVQHTVSFYTGFSGTTLAGHTHRVVQALPVEVKS
ncbi:MAG: hypothetical protein ABI702_19645 [Burkholderiales bacterium]